ncbi:MAG: flagellar protein FliT [Candidatus Competibacteraceae bacterium]|nr:MAG: flagellar protein FliT [Candidatus Competibacteraceae bacterium]
MNAPTDWEPCIQRLRALSVDLLDQARAGAWETVTEREQERRAVLEELFRQPVPEAVAPQFAEAVRDTLASDAEAWKLARGEMDRLGDALKALNQGRRALSAYQDA